MGGVVSLVRSTWALSYAVYLISVLVLIGTSIKSTATKSRPANFALSILGAQVSELPLTVILLNVIFYVWLTVTGTARESTIVRLFNYINVISTIGLLYMVKLSFESKGQVEQFLTQLSKESKKRVELPGPNSLDFLKKAFNPLSFPKDCTKYDSIPYWSLNEQRSAMDSDGWESVLKMALDVFRPNSVEGGDDRPVFVYIHGGAWTKGDKWLTGPIVEELIARKWVVVSINYRLDTKAGYPSHLIDCKRALRWIKDEIRIFGGDPNNVIVGGDSAGGHLAALLALTANLPQYQPGFEEVDTSVQGCVPLSASLDILDTNGYNKMDSKGRFLRDVAHREGSSDSPDNIAFLKEHSPFYRVKDAKVPFFLVHGDHDIIIPVGIARDFVKEFQSKSNAPVSYLEIPGGKHAFHVFPSPRTWYTTIATAEWLEFHFDKKPATSEKKLQVHELVEWGW
ncbi:hypothetical protein BGZ49_008929 [Haplosporangium sp. Z 27]|nr:hypothetical protein BGZ49_008929 [Haplosporangium sp. Z 27]